MRFSFTEDQLALRDAVRDLLAKECPPEVVRAAWPEPDADGQGPGAGARSTPEQLAAVWHHLAEMGVLGLLVPEDRGGLGFDEVAAALVLEETGYVAVPHPVVETVCVAAPGAGGPARRLRPAARRVLAGTRRMTATAFHAGAPWPWATSSSELVLLQPPGTPRAVGSRPSTRGWQGSYHSTRHLPRRRPILASTHWISRGSTARSATGRRRSGSTSRRWPTATRPSWRSTGRRWGPRPSSSGCRAGCST